MADEGFFVSSSDRNPSPPSNYIEVDDIIPGTVIEKNWILKTILSAVKELPAVDLDSGLETELCKLWDISMDDEVGEFLIESECHISFIGIIVKSDSPRLTEICFGILANLICKPQVCQKLSEIEDFTSIVLMQLSNPDALTLLQILRLLMTCLETRPVNEIWLELIKNKETILENFIFILTSSTNENVLESSSQIIDIILDSDDEILVSWSKNDLIEAIIEGFTQLSLTSPPSCDNFCHILQLISTNETGKLSILNHSKQITSLIEKHLNLVCSMDFIDLCGRHCGLASSFDILEKLVTTIDWKKKKLLNSVMKLTVVIEKCEHMSTMDKILRDSIVSFWSRLIQSQIQSIFSTLDKAREEDLNSLLSLLNNVAVDVDYLYENLESANRNRLSQIVQTFCSSR